MSWLFLALTAYFLLAIAILTDKLVVSKFVMRPIVYTTLIGLLSVTGLVMLPFGIHWAGWDIFFINFVAGVSFFLALFFMYSAFAKNEVTRISTLIGALSPIAVLIFSVIFLQEKLLGNQIAGFVLLVFGSLFFFFAKEEKSRLRSFGKIFLAALFFAGYFVIMKYVYTVQDFPSAFLFNRIGSFVPALLLLLVPKIRKELKQSFFKKDATNQTKSKTAVIFFGQVCGGACFIMQNYAVKTASVSLVSALQGVQYVFLFLLIAIVSRFVPEIKERNDKKSLTLKICAIVIIAIGLYFLSR